MSDLLIEKKNILLNYCKSILVPALYQGFLTIYEDSIKINESGNDDGKNVLIIFQKIIKKIPEWSKNLVSEEVKRIKSKYNCAIYLEQLIKKIVKLLIKIISYNDDKEFADKLDVEDFIHKCYIRSSIMLYMSCYLMYHKYKPVDLKKNQTKAQELIAKSIEDTFVSVLPLNKLLLEQELNSDNHSLLEQINQSLKDIKEYFKINSGSLPVLINNPDEQLNKPVGQLNKQLQITTDLLMDRDNPKISYHEDEKSPKMINLDKVTQEKKNSLPSIAEGNANIGNMDFANTSEERKSIKPAAELEADPGVVPVVAPVVAPVVEQRGDSHKYIDVFNNKPEQTGGLEISLPDMGTHTNNSTKLNIVKF